ncbi:MAG: glycoside hydrolase family 3 C-terminal domain-containing protein, partial [Gemmatimonadota bacterium]|nr:glycoside hydrolase family 3 C-terminal domain-containing protein [Gemmatimonadota bacterium]
LAAELSAAGLRVEQARVGPGTTRAEFARLRQRAAVVELTVVSVSIAPFQYRELGLEGPFSAWVEALAADGHRVVAVSLGSPYVVEAFPSVGTYLLGWSTSGASQRAVASALLGNAPIGGRLPVSLPPNHRQGEGLTR